MRARKTTVMRIVREQRGLSQASLGKKIGVGQSKVSAWESGQVRCPLRHAQALAEALGVRAEYLFLEPQMGLPVTFS